MSVQPSGEAAEAAEGGSGSGTGVRVKLAAPASEQTFTPYFREYSLLIEYKHLRKYAPGGVYVMPSLDTLHVWYGVVFVRQGYYRQGIFKFVMRIPEDYPEARPSIKFHSRLFHPQIDAEGNLDLSAGFPTWTAHKDYLWHVLAYLKRVFYKISIENPVNQEAAHLYATKRDVWAQKVLECVKESIKQRHISADPKSSVVFTPWKSPAHDIVRERILNPSEEDQAEGAAGLLQWVKDHLPAMKAPSKR